MGRHAAPEPVEHDAAPAPAAPALSPSMVAATTRSFDRPRTASAVAAAVPRVSGSSTTAAGRLVALSPVVFVAIVLGIATTGGLAWSEVVLALAGTAVVTCAAGVRDRAALVGRGFVDAPSPRLVLISPIVYFVARTRAVSRHDLHSLALVWLHAAAYLAAAFLAVFGNAIGMMGLRASGVSF